MHYRPRLSKESALAEIAKRYREKSKRHFRNQPKPRTRAAVRIAELTRLYDYKWGKVVLPDTAEGMEAARIMAHHIAHLKDASRRISDWLATCAPWLPLVERERLINDALECPLKWRADKLAWKIGVTEETRTKLKLTTIGAVDCSKAQREQRRRQRSTERKRDIRRANGAKPRAAYERQSRTKRAPWVVAGLSRATWYRRQRET